MNLYSFSVIVFAICSLLLGFQIFLKRSDRIGLFYFWVSLLYAVWGVGFGLGISGGWNYDTSLVSLRVANVAAAFIPTVWLHFCLIYTNASPKRLNRQRIFYFFPIAILLGSGTQFFIPYIRSSAGFPYYPYPGILCHLEMALYYVLVPIAFFQLIKRLKKVAGDEKKKMIGFLTIAFLGYFGGAFSFFPVYGYDFPQYGLFLLPLYPFGLAYFMSSKGLFDLENIAQAAHKDKLAALGILTASINHEIRSPLFVMRALVDTEAKDSPLQTKLSDQINRITGIVSRLTHFAKKGVEEAAQIEAIDLKEVLIDIRPLFQHQLNYQQIEYNQEIPNDLPKVLADRRYLEEILFNLILNACQALRSTENPMIKLSAVSPSNRGSSHERRATNSTQNGNRGAWSVDRGSSEIVITISDNGPGILPEQLKTIFKPFHTTKQEGTGLGLYITKQLVEKCGAKIEVQSQLGCGAQFKVSFKAK